MGIYSPEIENIITHAPVLSNPLFKYDNYTYHIQFFMVDSKTFKEYNDARYRSLTDANTVTESITYTESSISTSTQCAKDAYELIKNKKIIIAESGVTNNIGISELVMKSVPAFGNSSCYCATEEFKLKIVETAGNGLVNRMHIATSLLGYESYINTPLFLSIWFEGYDNTNKEKPIANILNLYNNQYQFTYEVIIEEVNTSVNLESTTYDMTLRPITDTGLKDRYSYTTNEKYSPWPRNATFKFVLNKLQEMKNEEIKKSLGESYIEIYGTDDAVSLEIVNKMPDDEQYKKTLTDGSDTSEEIIKFLDEYYEAYNARNGNFATAEQKQFLKEHENEIVTLLNNIGDVGKIERHFRNQYINRRGEIIDAKKTLTDKFYTLDKEAVENHVDGYWPGGSYQPSNASNLYSIISDIWTICSPKSGIIPTINIVPEYVKDYNNESFYKQKVYIIFQKYPGLSEMIDGIKNKDYYLHSEENQKKYLDICYGSHCILKRYNYLLNGKDTSILSYDTKEDMFWYLNAGNLVEYDAKANTPQFNYDEIIQKFDSTMNPYLAYKNKIINIINSKLEAIKKHNNTNIVTIDELIDLASEASIKEIRKSIFKASLMNDVKYNLQPIYSSVDEDKNDSNDVKKGELNSDISIAQYAAKNMLSHGQKLELKMKIIGDPYWLSFTPENDQVLPLALPHLFMCIKTYTKNDEYDNPQEDTDMEINTIYTVTDVTSTFSNGVFTQDLHGFVPPPFVQQYMPELSKDEDIAPAMMLDENGRASLVAVDPTSGKVINPYQLNPGEVYNVVRSNTEKKMTEFVENTSEGWINDKVNKMSVLVKDSKGSSSNNIINDAVNKMSILKK